MSYFFQRFCEIKFLYMDFSDYLQSALTWCGSEFQNVIAL